VKEMPPGSEKEKGDRNKQLLAPVVATKLKENSLSRL